MSELVVDGKVRAIGVSNVTADQLAEAAATAEIAAVQNEYSLLAREAERDLLPACLELGVGFVPYFPLASGFLTGKYRAGEAAEPARGWGRSRTARPSRAVLRHPSRRSSGCSASPKSRATPCWSWRSPAWPPGPASRP